IKQVLRDLNIDTKRFEPRAMMGKINTAKNELITPKDFRKQAKTFYDEQIADVYEAYQTLLRKNNSLDFADLIMQTVHLFNRVPDVLTYYQRRFQYIHVVEYQDTNYAQYNLIILTLHLLNRVQDMMTNYQHRIQYIHVKEYTETHHAQFVSITQMANQYQNSCDVEDSNQSI